MEEIIKILKELGSIPIVTIPVGAIIGAVAAYLLSIYSKSKQNQLTTKQVLSYINVEIHDNFANRIKRKYPYNELGLKGFEFISRQAGNIVIKEKQLIEINRVYTLFDEINKDILHIREAKYQGKRISELHEKLVELQNRCFTIAGEYLNKYSHNK